MGKLVECRSCGTAISKQARACPKCGAPPAKSRIGTIAGLTVIGVIVAGAVGAADKKEQQQQEVVQGTSAIYVSADQLHKDYSANEISADERYRNKVLRVTGAVQSINKDIMDSPYVVLWTTNEFQGVHAHFANASGLSSLSKSAHIAVRCRGDNQVLGSPQLKDCVLE